MENLKDKIQRKIKQKMAIFMRSNACLYADIKRGITGEKINYIQPCFRCRLGNLIFQIAACYAHGLRHDIPVRAEWDLSEDIRFFRYILGDLSNLFPSCGSTR